jgi:hypothetical protein
MIRSTIMKLRSIVFILSAFLFFIPIQSSYAADASMGFTPSSGSYGKPFKASLVIDGHGEKFNAAGATVKLPSQLKVKDLVLGDCNLSFLTTPTEKNLSFEGVILSSYATKCTAYTITAVPAEKGDAELTISSGKVKRYGDATEIYGSKQNQTASYSITAVSKDAETLGTEDKDSNKQEKPKNYSLTLTIHAKDPKQLENAEVILTPVSKKNVSKAKPDGKNTVHFENIPAGIYDVVVENNKKKVGETIINVSGASHTITLGIDLDAQKNNPLMKDAQSIFSKISSNPILLGGILLFGVILGIIIAILIMKVFSKKKS